MKPVIRTLVVLTLLLAVATIASPTQAATGAGFCLPSPLHGPVGTVFTINCADFTPGRIVNIWATEPDGRASALNIYGFFPTSAKVGGDGTFAFPFVTEIPGFAAIPPGDYIFDVKEMIPDSGGIVSNQAEFTVTVDSPTPNLGGAALLVTPTQGTVFDFVATGFLPGEWVSVWVTQPPAAQCSGIGIDQLTLGTLGVGSSSIWDWNFDGNQAKADATGTLAFTVMFRPSACVGEHWITVEGGMSKASAAVSFIVQGATTAPVTNASVFVDPQMVPAYNSFLNVSGVDFLPNTGVSCWFTRPDGRVLEFLSVNAHTDATGAFSVGATLDDFPPFSSTDPGVWSVTCADTHKVTVGSTTFTVFGLPADP